MTPEETGNRIRPYVKRVHRGRPLSRSGRGFSEQELQQAGITMGQARKLEIHVDLRRKTAYATNVDLLKSLPKNGRSGTRESHGGQE